MDWVTRFKLRSGIGAGDYPTRIDFEAHGAYYGVKFDKLEHEPNRLEVRAYVNSLLDEQFDASDFFVTPDLRVWFTTEDQALTFKLCFTR